MRSTGLEAHHVVSQFQEEDNRYDFEDDMPQTFMQCKVATTSEVHDVSIVLACHDCCSSYLGDSPSESFEVLLSVVREHPSSLYSMLSYAQARSLTGIFASVDADSPRQLTLPGTNQFCVVC